METPIKEGQRWDRKDGKGFIIIKFVYRDNVIAVSSTIEGSVGMNRVSLEKNYKLFDILDQFKIPFQS